MKKSKDLEYYLALPYSILLVPDEDGWYAEIPELPGCMTAGDTKEEVLELIEDAKQSWLIVSLEHGDPIPEPEPYYHWITAHCAHPTTTAW